MTLRRPPAPFLTTGVEATEWLTPRLARVTLKGPELRALEVSQPASSVRVLLPDPEHPHAMELPGWDGNRFVLSDGRRPTLRTLTPRYNDRDGGTLQVDVVVHGKGAAALWASTASPGSPVAVSGPARGYTIDPDASTLVLGGDETAIAAIGQILEALPDHTEALVQIETINAESRPPLPSHPRCRVKWVDQDGLPGEALVEQLGQAELPDDARLWAAGEAAAMQRLRQRLFNERGIPRGRATIRGYWKHGRGAEDQSDTA
jgi:NADPH-dependent ferric siderophore reductase